MQILKQKFEKTRCMQCELEKYEKCEEGLIPGL